MKMETIVAPLHFREMLPGDAVLLDMQPSQHFDFGVEHKRYSLEESEELAAGGIAWTAYRGSRIVGVAGLKELFTGHAVAWAVLSAELGADHLAITRFAKATIAAAPYRRIEAVVDAANRRALAWAKLVGLEPVYTLRGYGAEGTDHILFERIAA